jgi:uncharacterized protein YndB with AHSA1/START domain
MCNKRLRQVDKEKEMPNIIHRIGAKAPIEAVYQAVATPEGIAGWWSEQTAGGSQAGDTVASTFINPETGEHVGTIDYTLEQLVPNQHVGWRIKSGAEEWVGTLVRFDLSEADGYTVVSFGHEGWAEPVEFMAHCSTKWATFLMSLKAYVETGAGQPAPVDVQISNWH